MIVPYRRTMSAIRYSLRSHDVNVKSGIFEGKMSELEMTTRRGKKLVILQNSLEKNLGDVTTHHTGVENSKKYRILSKVQKVYYADCGSDKNISGFFSMKFNKIPGFLDSIYAKCDILKSF